MLQVASFTVEEWLTALTKRYPERFPNMPDKGTMVGVEFRFDTSGVLTVKVFDR